MLFETIAYAQEGAQAQAGPMDMFMAFLPIILMFVFMYFILIRPRKKEEKALKGVPNLLPFSLVFSNKVG